MIKLQERAEAADGGGRDRRKDKDALDVLRILRAIDMKELAVGLELLAVNELSQGITKTALDALPVLFGRADSLASQMAADAASPGEARDVTAASCAALVGELLGLVNEQARS